jgi:hypothetical protein
MTTPWGHYGQNCGEIQAWNSSSKEQIPTENARLLGCLLGKHPLCLLLPLHFPPSIEKPPDFPRYGFVEGVPWSRGWICIRLRKRLLGGRGWFAFTTTCSKPFLRIEEKA